MKIALWLWWVSVLPVAMAGGDNAGNSGTVIQCDIDGERTYDLLDYFEGKRQSPPLIPDFELNGKADPVNVALRIVDRLRELDPERHLRYQNNVDNFLAQVDWITDGPGLDDVPDLGKVDVPENCQLRQLAIHRRTFHPSIKPFLIDKRIWNRLDVTLRAGLILHEVIYSEMIELGQNYSTSARAFNALLTANAFEDMNESEYEAVISEYFKKVPRLAFRADIFDINVGADDPKPYTLALRSLLQSPIERNLGWYFMETLPGWLTFSQEAETITAVEAPASSTPLVIRLVVQDGIGGAIAQLRFHVKELQH